MATMKSEVQVAIIGGGVVGCSVLYHLTKLGWKDVVLIERSELTSGSTWHAAGGFHTINGDPNVAKLQAYTIDLYKEIEEISGQSCGLHITGGYMLAGTEERMDWLKMTHARGQYLDMDTRLASLDEVEEHVPIIDKSQFVGALYNPVEGHLDPSGTTHAYAGAARKGGAEIYLRNRVTGLTQRADGTWDVATEQGSIHAEHVVNAGGLWAREVGLMVGLKLPVLAMEHMYLLTEEIPDVVAHNEKTGKEILHVIDFEGEIYIRQEGKGMLMGTYEKAGVPWSTKTTPWDFGHELLQPDIDRIAPSLEVGFKHFPAFEEAGIKQIINGPFTFAPDGNPLVGPVRNLKNYWCACAVMAGFSQGGGVGLALSNWIVNGDPGFDVWAMDVARFGEWTTSAYTSAKVRENYSRRFSITFPNEQLPAARPMRTTPIYDRLKAKGAVFGAAYGLESAMWFAPEGVEPVEDITFRRSNAFEHVAKEVAAVRSGVGMMEISSFAKYQVSGPGAEAWLNKIMANKLPDVGKLALCPMLNESGKVIGDFTVATLGPGHFMIFGSGVAESYHMRWFNRHMPEDGSVIVHPFALDLVGLSVAGPKSRELLQKISDADLSNEAFPFLSIQEMEIGLIRALVGRISFTGDLGYEIWVRPEHMIALYDALEEAGAEFGLQLFGSRALDAMRLEKSFGSWARDYRPIYDAYEAGLGMFVNMNKGDFIGRDASAKVKEAGPERRLVTFTVDADGADVLGDEPVWHDGKVVGWVTSGGYAHNSDASVALGYIPADLATDFDSDKFEIEIIGERRPVKLESKPLFDANGGRMRG